MAAFVPAADDLVTGKKGELPLKGQGFVTFKDKLERKRSLYHN